MPGKNLAVILGMLVVQSTLVYTNPHETTSINVDDLAVTTETVFEPSLTKLDDGVFATSGQLSSNSSFKEERAAGHTEKISQDDSVLGPEFRDRRLRGNAVSKSVSSGVGQQQNKNSVGGEEVLDWDLLKWTAPRYIQKTIPYYLAGYDEEGRPIWIFEYGKMDIKSIVEKGPQAEADLEKYCRQFMHRLIQSIQEQNTTERPVTEAVYLMDFEGLQLRQLAHLPSVSFVLRLASEFRKPVLKYSGPMIVINANFVAEQVINLVRPIFGELLAQVEVYGTNKQRWLPAVRRVFNAKNLPEWYGGSDKNYKPLAVYG